jgi:folate-binding protein YgfZ
VPNTKDQVEAARRGALVVPAPELAVFVVTGSERLTWLNGQLTCDLAARQPGDAVYGLAVALKGRIVSDVILVVDAERVLMLAQRQAADLLAASLDKYLMMEDAQVEPRIDAWDAWLVHGPRAGDVLAAARAVGGVGGALDRTGLGGAVVLAEGEARARVREALERAAADAGGMMGDAEGWDALRLERGVPRFGADFDGETYPQEASLEKTAVSFSKGCYLGQEVVCMLEMRGHVKRKLVPLVMQGGQVPARGTPLLDDAGAAVGEVTSAALSPTLGKPVALAMLKHALATPGHAVRVLDQKAEVVERPV